VTLSPAAQGKGNEGDTAIKTMIGIFQESLGASWRRKVMSCSRNEPSCAKPAWSGFRPNPDHVAVNRHQGRDDKAADAAHDRSWSRPWTGLPLPDGLGSAALLGDLFTLLLPPRNLFGIFDDLGIDGLPLFYRGLRPPPARMPINLWMLFVVFKN